jgi:hypothetical protein
MASEKKTKTPPKAEAASKAETPKKIEAPGKEAAKEPAVAADAATPETAKADAAPTRYSRGEGQKAVTQAYKDNWNDIFGSKSKAKPVKPSKKKKR